MRIFDHKTMTYRNNDGTLDETLEQELSMELLREKWRMNNALGHVDITKMFHEFDELEKRRAELNISPT